ncbi:hypothetical protein DM01DRAFT_1376315 [Hesseltinella vesiculosa]|uniref:RanBP2-type domain-containing protein n=1 Tax=Hesseltinella vesiculosa TaxID=101127 RepID=A0A1X2GAU2_9FUNG|nr:hypothetical protein DM01DRAFT_1376315 [Hesseltinella vesiculosa]
MSCSRWRTIQIKKADLVIRSLSNKSPPRNMPEIKPRFRPGDWTCPQCQFINHAHRTQCRECDHTLDGQSRTPSLGDWICPECQYYNFRRQLVCRKCTTLKPIPTA